MRIGPARLSAGLFIALTCIFLLLPLVIVIPMSFNPKSYESFPPTGLSLQWYREFFTSSEWMGPLWLSVRVGVASAAVATVLGMMVAVALVRILRRGRTIVRVGVLSPLIVPYILTAIASYDTYSRLGLAGTTLGLILAHTVLALPFTTIILAGALESVDRRLEEAAMSMGTTAVGAFLRVSVRLILPSVATAVVVAFLTSWDEVVVALFLSGDVPTLPAQMFSFITTEIRPTIAAVSTLLLALVLVGIAGQRTWRWLHLRRLRRRAVRLASERRKNSLRGAVETTG